MKSKVYFIPIKDSASVAEQTEKMKKIVDFSQAENIVSPEDFVAVKFHVGEGENKTRVAPELIKVVVDKIKQKKGQPFLTETSTLYKGERENAVKHIMHAHRQGFGIESVGAPFVMSDGLLGNTEHEVEINCELNKTVKIAKEVVNTDAVIVVSHPTGHVIAGVGACIKNLGMGFASRQGKMRQHSQMKPEVKSSCRFCKKCISWCPESAITEKDEKAYIDSSKCIGCGECIAVCNFDAVTYDYNNDSEFVQKSMAEYAYGAVKDKKNKIFYFNVLINMTKECDCYAENQPKLIPDVGILASSDPVAIDKATLDLTCEANGQNLGEIAFSYHDPLIQIKHAEKIGMGSSEYELVVVE
ncbi:DUF362 domain-containing protein [Selenomonadales bacterium OttesenSCG-928-I06]|nr:DUF362 domain-containing protein [Selenomonadales bacterium OttesenSCG-928-I06]